MSNKNPNLCWFCAGADKNQALVPDGRPLCAACVDKLLDFRAWLNGGCR